MRGINLVKSRSVTSRSSTIASTARRAATLSFLAVVMTFSTQRRSSLPLASVVSMRPWSSKDVTRLRLIALRWAVLRLNLRPAFWCRTRLGLLDQDLGQLIRREEAALYQFFVDLVQRLPAEVAQAQKILLAQRHQLADLGDLVGLEAVQRANGEVEVLDRPVRPDLEDQLVPVGLLADAGLLDQEVRLHDRAEDGVDRNHADRLAFLLVPLGGHIALATLDRQLHAEPALVAVERADVQFRVDDLDVTGRLDVGRLDLAGAGHVERQANGIVTVGDQVQPLEVEDDLGDVLLDVRNRGKLVRHALDRDRGHGGALQRAQQHAAKRITQRGAEAGLQRLDLELSVAGGVLDAFDLGLGDIDHGAP